MQIYLD